MNAPELLSQESPSQDMSPFPEVHPGAFEELDVIQAARTGACVLITGRANAKGIALLIHSLSGWRWGPFVSIDCGASEKTLERQLFDVIAATEEGEPAAEPRPRLTQDGTVFLYEVGKLSLAMQGRLADALAAGSPGDTRRRSRKRVMASTSVPLFERVLAGTFDDRLFYRLNAIQFAASEEGPEQSQS